MPVCRQGGSPHPRFCGRVREYSDTLPVSLSGSSPVLSGLLVHKRAPNKRLKLAGAPK